MRPGTTIHGYTILGELGSGAMGAVYLARQTSVDRLVALKVLPPILIREQPGFADMFLKEARTAAQLDHPAIVRIHDAGSMQRSGNPLLYYAMEYIEGEHLADRLQRDGHLEPIQINQILGPIALALGYAGKRGLVHRDVKPANILIGEDGTAKLADFGLVVSKRDNTQATIAGSPPYISPEAAAGKDLDHRSDQYALGCTLFECLTGVQPFVGTSTREILEQHVEAPIPDARAFADCSPDLAMVAQRMMAKKPADRFTNNQQAAQAINQASYAQTPTPTPSRSGRSSSRIPSHRSRRSPSRKRGHVKAGRAQQAADRRTRTQVSSRPAIAIASAAEEPVRDPIAEAMLWPFVAAWRGIRALPRASRRAGGWLLAWVVIIGAWIVDTVAWAMPFVRSFLHWLTPKLVQLSHTVMGLTWQIRIAGGRGEALTARASQTPIIGVMPAGSLLPYVWPAVLDDQRQPFTNLVHHDLGEVMFGPLMSRWAQREQACPHERAAWLHARHQRLRSGEGLPPLVAADPRDPGAIDEDLLRLATSSGSMLVPLAASVRPGWRFRHSPHRHVIPVPGAQIVVHVGRLIPTAGRSQAEIASELSQRLTRLQAAADRDAQTTSR